MKKAICLAITLFVVTNHINAQDLIVTKDQRFIYAYHLDIGKHGIYFQLDNKKDTLFHQLELSEILIIQLEDGTKIDPDKECYYQQINETELLKKKPGNKYYGTGRGSGSGIDTDAGAGIGDFWLDGRPVICKAYPKARENTSGIVVVEFRADRNGNVIYAKAGARGTTINDAALWAECERAAKLSKFKAKEDAPTEQRGTIRYRFVVR